MSTSSSARASTEARRPTGPPTGTSPKARFSRAPEGSASRLPGLQDGQPPTRRCPDSPPRPIPPRPDMIDDLPPAGSSPCIPPTTQCPTTVAGTVEDSRSAFVPGHGNRRSRSHDGCATVPRWIRPADAATRGSPQAEPCAHPARVLQPPARGGGLSLKPCPDGPAITTVRQEPGGRSTMKCSSGVWCTAVRAETVA